MAEENNKESGLKEEHKNTFVERLQQASNEIDSIKNSFSRGMDDLAKIQSMLSLDGVNKFTGMIQGFEDRLSEAERRTEEATEGAKRYSEELEKEKERLIKLWDAYKNQEETLSTQEKRALEFEEKLREVEQSKMQMEADLTTRINTLTQKLEEKEQDALQSEEFKQKIMEFDGIRNQLEETIHDLRGEINAKDETIKSLETQVEELKQFEQSAEFKTKFEEVSEEYEKEKERLTKLFRLYEETEAETKRLKEETKGWQDWFDSNEEIFSKLFSSADHLRRTVTSESTPVENETVSPPPQMSQPTDTTKKPKKKLRFKK